jgi:predicted peptidase
MREILIASLLGATGISAATPEAREWKAPNGTIVKYRWSVPETPVAGKSYPLVLFLHGAGERGKNNKLQLRHGVIPIIEGARKLGQPCFLIAPQCPPGVYWSPIDGKFKRLSAASEPNPLMDAVIALVGDVMGKHPVDPKRFYVTGISMGGFATWDLLGRIPDQVAAAVPICGGGDPNLAYKFKDVPIHAFHGEEDSEVPVAATRIMIAALEKAGGKPRATYYPGVDHVCWTRTYDNPEVIRWMFAQRRE